MQLILTYGAVLILALLALALPALAHKQHWAVMREGWQRSFAAIFHELLFATDGYTVTYCWPGGASGPTTTAPTQTQAAQVHMQTALVAMGDAETFAYFTHGWGGVMGPQPAASFAGFLFPVCFYRQSDIGVGPSTQLAALTFNLANTNVVIINKVAGVGNGGTFVVTLFLPATNIR